MPRVTAANFTFEVLCYAEEVSCHTGNAHGSLYGAGCFAEVIPDFAYNAGETIKADSDGKAAILIRNATFNVIGMEFNASEFKDKANPNVTRGTFAACLSFLVK